MFSQGILSNISTSWKYSRKYGNRSIPRGRLTRLIKCTTGEAEDLIKHGIQETVSEGYKYAFELLRTRYCVPLKLLATYREKKKVANNKSRWIIIIYIVSHFPTIKHKRVGAKSQVGRFNCIFCRKNLPCRQSLVL